MSPPGPGAGSGRLLLVLVLVVVLTQRLALPLGGGGAQLPLSLPLALAVLGWGLLGGSLRLDRTRTRLYSLAMAAATVLTLLALARGLSPSLFSYLLLLSLYLAVAVRPTDLPRAEVDRVLSAFVTLMVVVALVCSAQAAVQYLGVAHEDWLARVVPQPFLVQGYNTGDPLSYGSSIYRVNGVLFLEPSFVSYFLGLAAVVALHLGRSSLVVGLLLVGLVPTLAGNGVVILLLGVLVLALGPRRGHLRALVLPVTAAVLVALATPVAARFATRLTEGGNEGSSLSLRVVEPYGELLPRWLADPATTLLGRGAGAAGEFTAGEAQGLLAPVVPKLLLEYGGVGTALFLLFLLWSVLAGGGERPWTLALLVGYLVLNAALLQVTLALATVLFVHLLRPWDPTEDPPEAAAPAREPLRTRSRVRPEAAVPAVPALSRPALDRWLDDLDGLDGLDDRDGG
ncbi:hypothetical protein [Jannaschia sp. R86511]|uniref:hypothetical protein n=1 Tax=Jannaschia sp. R86511 TaxID=3093853 RepID=UPI0036D3F96E